MSHGDCRRLKDLSTLTALSIIPTFNQSWNILALFHIPLLKYLSDESNVVHKCAVSMRRSLSSHDGRLLRTFPPSVSHKSFLAHSDIFFIPFEAKLCRIVNAKIFVGNCNYFNDLLVYFWRYDVINDARFWREL